MKKYRVYEAIDSNGINFKEHDYFDEIEYARCYAKQQYDQKPTSTFIINYLNDDKTVTEEYFGKYTG